MTSATAPRARIIDQAKALRLAAALTRQSCERLEPLTVSEWAVRYRRLPETSTSPGPYDLDAVPYARRPMDCMGDPEVSRVVLCWAAQTTKSTCIENAFGYRIHRSPSPMVVVCPKIDAAESWAKERLTPMVIATPVLRERVRLGRSSDSTLRYKRFPGGFIFVASAQSATELASRSAPFVACDEVDRFEEIKGEGNPVEIVSRRQGAADVGMEILTSTPRDADATIIWPYLEGGTFELYHVPCPHCGEFQPLVWSGLQFSKERPSEAVYACQHNGCVIEEREKPKMLLAGEWRATNPEGTYPSFHLNGLYSPFAKSSWGTLAHEWVRAQGKPGDLQVFINTRLAELWTDTDTRVHASELAAEGRQEPLEEGVVPEGVGLITLGVDVQANRIEARAWGWGEGLESWLLQRWVLLGDPSQEPDVPGSIWASLDAVLATTFRHVSGQVVPIRAGLMDSGFATTQVYKYCDPRRKKPVRLFYASKGIPGARPVLGKPSIQTTRRIPLYPVGVDGAKDEFIRSQILERSPGPGYVHLPQWAETQELEGLVSEERKRVGRRGASGFQIGYVWRKRGDIPNEPLDCRIYARAAVELLPNAAKSLGAWASDLAVPTDAPAPAPEAADTPPRPIHDDDDDQPSPRRRGNWITSWK